jgi:hypothetical protein
VQRIVGKGFMVRETVTEGQTAYFLGSRQQGEGMEENAQMLMRES